jgi:hypothetical protein
LVRAGFVTLSPEHFCCATRLPKEGLFDTASFYRRHPLWSALGKSTYENHIAVDVLQSLPLVNPQRIGATRFYAGGHNKITKTAYDQRIRCAVPMCAGLSINLWENCLDWSRDHWYIYLPQLREKLLKGERIQCDWHEMMALAAPRPLLEIFSFSDINPRTQEHRAHMHLRLAELYRLLRADGAHAHFIFGDGHALPDPSRALLVSWMERFLRYQGLPLGGWDSTPTHQP